MLIRLMGLPESASAHAFEIDQMLEFIHWFITLLFVGWFCFYAYMLFRFHRSRNPKAQYKGLGGLVFKHLEFTVVLIEAVILLGFAIPIWTQRVADFPNPKTSPNVVAFGQQFNWTFHYPGPDGKFGRRDLAMATASNPLGIDKSDPNAADDFISSEIHLPVNQAAIVTVTSKDVIHNFALPNMRIAKDATPGNYVPIWFTPNKVGVYKIICGQLCGVGHSMMAGEIQIHSAEDYQAWLKEQTPIGTADDTPVSKPTVAAK